MPGIMERQFPKSIGFSYTMYRTTLIVISLSLVSSNPQFETSTNTSICTHCSCYPGTAIITGGEDFVCRAVGALAQSYTRDVDRIREKLKNVDVLLSESQIVVEMKSEIKNLRAVVAELLSGSVNDKHADGHQRLKRSGATDVTGYPGFTGTGATGAAGPYGRADVSNPTESPSCVCPPGPAGPPGPPGPPGGVGYTGATGRTGVRGSSGASGPIGGQGATGMPGSTGNTGATGVQGPRGSPGEMGIQGPPGSIVYTGLPPGFVRSPSGQPGSIPPSGGGPVRRTAPQR